MGQMDIIWAKFEPNWSQRAKLDRSTYFDRRDLHFWHRFEPEVLALSELFWKFPPYTHWPDFHWNVSKPWLQRVDLFENYAIVAMQSDNVTFLSFKIIKVTSGFNLKKTIFFTRWRHHPKNSWNIFQIQITPLLWRSQGPQGCLEKQNCPLSLNLAVWCAKIGPKS